MVTQKRYIVIYRYKNTRAYVSARPGWIWTATGVQREPVGFRSPSPEWTAIPEQAYIFKSHRAAARIANLSPTASIQEAF